MQKQIIYDNSSPVSDKEDNIAIEENDEQSLLPSQNIQLNQIPKDAPYYEILNQNENQTNEQYDDDDNNNTETEPNNNNHHHSSLKQQQQQQQQQSFRYFISLNSLSKCQQCNNTFDNNHHLPFLFKCGHFFCKTCIETYFTTETGIACPIDGPTATTLTDLTILDKLVTPDIAPPTHQHQVDDYNTNTNNIIINSNSNNDAFCKVHRDQKLTHFVEETREVICVYCAINRMKNGNRITVKEINEKCKEYINDVDIIIENNNTF